jgi:hypothetical protein
VQNADSSSLFDDLDAALQSGSSEKQSGSSKKRVALLRQVTDLFRSAADRLNEKQIRVFDGVLVQLIERNQNAGGDQRTSHANCECSDRSYSEFGSSLRPESTPKARHEKLKIDFAKLSKSNTRRLLRFWQVRQVSARST